MKNQKTVKQLREDGVFVEVYHGRTHINNEDSSVYRGEDGLPALISRREAKLNGLNDTYTVFCRGGFTYVRLTTPDGKEVIGKRNFNKNEHFNRKLGLNIALGRALAKLEG